MKHLNECENMNIFLCCAYKEIQLCPQNKNKTSANLFLDLFLNTHVFSLNYYVNSSSSMSWPQREAKTFK